MGESIIKEVESNICLHCGKDIDSSWKYCPYCKKQMNYESCSFCHSRILSSWKHCPFCHNQIKIEYSGQEKIDTGNEWLRQILNN